MHTALVAGSSKAGHITNHATPQRDDSAVAVESILQQGVIYGVEYLEVLVFLAIGQDNRVLAQSVEL